MPCRCNHFSCSHPIDGLLVIVLGGFLRLAIISAYAFNLSYGHVGHMWLVPEAKRLPYNESQHKPTYISLRHQRALNQIFLFLALSFEKLRAKKRKIWLSAQWVNYAKYPCGMYTYFIWSEHFITRKCKLCLTKSIWLSTKSIVKQIQS